MLPVPHAFMNKSVSSSSKQQGALASTTGTGMLYVRHALMKKSLPPSVKQQREIAIFTVLMTT